MPPRSRAPAAGPAGTPPVSAAAVAAGRDTQLSRGYPYPPQQGYPVPPSTGLRPAPSCNATPPPPGGPAGARTDFEEHIAAGLAERVEELAAMQLAQLRHNAEQSDRAFAAEQKGRGRQFALGIVTTVHGHPDHRHHAPSSTGQPADGHRDRLGRSRGHQRGRTRSGIRRRQR